jgi:dTDP-4-amino-4,6-dideoxygalactose transaminase
MIPFSPPYIDQDVKNEVLDVLDSGWITSGPKVMQLEDEISKLVKVEKSLCVNSWTSAAILVLKWFGVGKGDEVIIPAYTYSATALAVLHCGATPVMVDIKEDLTIDFELISQFINSNTKAIIPVDIAGWPCDYDKIFHVVNLPENKQKFCPNSEKQHKLGRMLIMSDAAHSIGATYKGKKVGNLADITIFSFHAVKNVTTAEGGAICINLPEPFEVDEEYKLMKLYSLNGQTKDAFTKSKAGGWKYDILFPGLKVNMPDICAAIGISQIRQYDKLLSERERVALRYHRNFKTKSYFEVPPLENNDRKSCFHLYALRVKDITEIQRDKIIEEITKAGVSVNVHFIPLPMLTAFKNLGFEISDYPISYNQYSREISLPIYPQLRSEQIDYIFNVVDQAYHRVLNSN